MKQERKEGKAEEREPLVSVILQNLTPTFPPTHTFDDAGKEGRREGEVSQSL